MPHPMMPPPITATSNASPSKSDSLPTGVQFYALDSRCTSIERLRLMQTLLGERLGTMPLVLLGDGAVANDVLNRTKGQNSGWIVITVGWGLGAGACFVIGF